MSSKMRLANLGIPTGLSPEEEKKRLEETRHRIEREIAKTEAKAHQSAY